MSDEPKHILSSHLALRFYKHLGWTKEILDQYVTRGRVMDQVGDQEVRDYWLLDNRQASRMDMERLYRELKPRVFHYNNQELFGEEAVEYMHDMNW